MRTTPVPFAFALAFLLGVPGAAPAGAQGLTRWLGDLASPQPTTWRIAAAQVAHGGAAGLDSLAAWLPGANATFRDHAKTVVSAALLTSIGPDDLARRPALRALGAGELARADRAAAALCASRELERDIGAVSDTTRSHHDELVALGGWAVPAAVGLTRCPGATGRVFGARVLTELHAGGQAAALVALTHDSTVVIASEEEEQGRTTVGELAAGYVRGFPFSNHVAEDGVPRTAGSEGEEYMNAVVRAEGLDLPVWRLDNALREQGRTDTAHTWDEFWARARPVLAGLWGPAPTAPGAPTAR